jgi:hypothetical protein
MIQPTFQVSEEIYIHAARAAVWQRFSRLTNWPRWRADVTAAKWIDGQAWQEGAQFTIQSAGSGAKSVPYLIRMVVPADTTVWESNSIGQGVVYSLQLTDQVGGCKVSLRCTFHGWGSLLKRLTYASETAKLRTMLSSLKESVEHSLSR